MTPIQQDLIPQGRRNRPGKHNPAEYITIHNTGNTAKGAGAPNHAAYLKGDAAAGAPVSWHYTVDDKTIIRHIPDNETAWHAGDGAGTGNSRSVGIEICVNSDGDLARATGNAAELTAELMRLHNVPIGKVVQHNRWSGKDCPQMLRGGKPYSWDVFMEKVQAAYAPTPPDPRDAGSAVPYDYPSPWAKPSCDKALAKGFVTGDGNGNVGWHDVLTLQKLAVLLDKMGMLDR